MGLVDRDSDEPVSVAVWWGLSESSGYKQGAAVGMWIENKQWVLWNMMRKIRKHEDTIYH